MTNPKGLQRALLVSPEKHSRDPGGAAGDMAVTRGIGCPKKSHMHLTPPPASCQTPGNLHMLSVPLISPLLNISCKGNKLLRPSRGINFPRFIRVIA